MDKETLVKSDLEIGGLVLNALSRDRIPVTLCVWNYVPQLEEWQLVIATPWYDTRGPREANDRVLAALATAGIYQSVPIRRLVVLSPHDPLARDLEHDVQTKTEGELFIMREDQNHPTMGRHYSAIFTPFASSQGAVPVKRIIGVEQLRHFLGSQLQIWPSLVNEAIEELDRRGSASLHIQLMHKEARRFGLA
jgi:hypothetical protein